MTQYNTAKANSERIENYDPVKYTDIWQAVLEYFGQHDALGGINRVPPSDDEDDDE